MKRSCFIAAAGLAGSLLAWAPTFARNTVLTITCEASKGERIAYGVTLADRVAAIKAHQRIPDPKLYPPHQDGLANVIITLESDGTAEVTYQWPKNLGGVETHDMRMLGWLNEFAFTLIEPGDSIGPTDIQSITFYPHESVAFFSGNTYDGFADADGRPQNELAGYAYFARCEYPGLAVLRQAEPEFYRTARPLVRK